MMDNNPEVKIPQYCSKCMSDPCKCESMPYKDEGKLNTSDTYKPDGKYARIGRSIGVLVDQKQAAYGDSFGKSGQLMRILYPEGIKVEQYDDMLTVVRIIDKLFRVATDKEAFGEDPFNDIAGYGLLASGFKRGIKVKEDS